MNENVLVRIKGIQFLLDHAGEPEEPIEILTAGKYEFREGKHVVEYEEVFEGTPDEATKNIVYIDKNTVEVHKTGQTNVDMYFETGKNNISYYSTPYGMIEMGIAATDVRVEEMADLLNIRAEYALSMNSQHIADCTLDMKIESKK